MVWPLEGFDGITPYKRGSRLPTLKTLQDHIDRAFLRGFVHGFGVAFMLAMFGLGLGLVIGWSNQ